MTTATTRVSQSVVLALALVAWGGSGAHAMSPQECYKRDSNCTQFCGNVTDPDWRHECFMRCNIYLDNCLATGNWTDQSATLSPGSDPTPPKRPKADIGRLPASGGLLDANPGFTPQGPAIGGAISGGAAGGAGPVLK